MKAQTILNLEKAVDHINEAMNIIEREIKVAKKDSDWGTAEYLTTQLSALMEFMSYDRSDCGFEEVVKRLGDK